MNNLMHGHKGIAIFLYHQCIESPMLYDMYYHHPHQFLFSTLANTFLSLKEQTQDRSLDILQKPWQQQPIILSLIQPQSPRCLRGSCCFGAALVESMGSRGSRRHRPMMISRRRSSSSSSHHSSSRMPPLSRRNIARHPRLMQWI